MFKLLVESITPLSCSSPVASIALAATMKVRLESVTFMAITDAKRQKKSVKRKSKKRRH